MTIGAKDLVFLTKETYYFILLVLVGMHRQRFSVVVPMNNIGTLEEMLNDRFLNDENDIQCPVEGCGGVQPLKLIVEKLPAILVIDSAVDGEYALLLCCLSDIESNSTIQGTQYG
jgi:hypothetical protein